MGFILQVNPAFRLAEERYQQVIRIHYKIFARVNFNI